MTAPGLRHGAELRLLRAAVFAAVCVALSAGGHVMASDEQVPLWSLGAAGVLVFAVAVPLAGRERSLPGIAAALAVAQTGLHCVFGIGQHTAAVRAGASESGGAVALARRLLCNDAGMPLSEGRARDIVANAGLDPDGLSGHAAHAGQAAAHGGAAATGGGMDASAYSLPMFLGHLLAALAAGWLLRRGDAALGSLVRLTAATGVDLGPLRAALRYVRALDTGLAPDGPVVRRVAAAVYDERRAAPVRVLAHSVIRRGPPALALAA